jgi:hypothetical protein
MPADVGLRQGASGILYARQLPNYPFPYRKDLRAEPFKLNICEHVFYQSVFCNRVAAPSPHKRKTI